MFIGLTLNDEQYAICQMISDIQENTTYANKMSMSPNPLINQSKSLLSYRLRHRYFLRFMLLCVARKGFPPVFHIK